MSRIVLMLAVAAWLASSIAPASEPQDPGGRRGLLIRNGTVIDGTGSPARSVSIRVRGETIAEMAADLTAADGEQVVDASGLVVAPGFIDIHSHADRGMESHPDAASQVLQGITTAVVGQDGGGTLPVSDFFDGIASTRPAINYATSVGHGTVRSLVLGADFKRAATAAEIETMKGLVDRAMRDGALGVSSGLEYDPGFYARPGELVELARVAARHGGFYSSHVRDEENTVFAAWREAIDVGRQARLPVQISHIKLASAPVWGRTAEGLKILEDAKREGVVVMADWYPYTYWQSSLYVLIPDRDFENRRKWEAGLAEIGGPQNVLITNHRPDPSLNGWTVAEIAAAAGRDPVTQIIEMIRAGGEGTGIIGTAMREEDLSRFFAHPQVLICSDGGITGRHPRGYGAFPRVLARYVREQKLVGLPEAIAKMTSRTAAQIGVPDRGVLAPGKKADIVMFSAEAVVDRGTPREPSLPPSGIRHVIVNGAIVLLDGTMTAARPGRAVKRQRGANAR